jgi:propionate CoA-transferase
VVNLGIGMPEGVAAVAAEENLFELLTLTAEPGVIGGVPAGGMSFGAAINAQAIIDQPNQFDFYDGGGLDVAVLGLAQADAQGNLNVSKFGGRLSGAGGFINISQNAKKVVFVGTFTAGDLQLVVGQGCPADSSVKAASTSLCRRWSTAPSARVKPSSAVKRCFTSPSAAYSGWLTRRAAPALELIELAPGMDLQRDILAQMDFIPQVSPVLKSMEPALFDQRPMGLRERLLQTPLAQRLDLDVEHQVLFINFEGLSIQQQDDIDAIETEVGKLLQPLAQRVSVVVNYDSFTIQPQLLDLYAAMVGRLKQRYYSRVTRYGTGGFLKARLESTGKSTG